MSIYNTILLKQQRRFQIQETSFEITKTKRQVFASSTYQIKGSTNTRLYVQSKTLSLLFCAQKSPRQSVPVNLWKMSEDIVNQITACGCQSLALGPKELQEILDFIFDPLKSFFPQIKSLHIDLKADRI